MKIKKLPLISAITITLALTTLGAPITVARAEAAPTSDDYIHITPSGSYLRTGGKTLFMPGTQFNDSVLAAILRAGGDTLYSKLTHQLMHMAMKPVYETFGTSGLYKYMQIAVPLAYNAYYLYYQWPKIYAMAAQGWERTQTTVGWRRRGRLPVFPGKELDAAVFMDYLIQTQEATGSAPWQLEITPLENLNPEQLSSDWQKSVARVVNAALAHNIDLVRISVNHKGQMTLSCHSQGSGKWQDSELYDALSGNEKYIAQWLENSWSDRQPNGLYSALEPAALECIEAKLSGQNTVCQPLTGISTYNASSQIYQIADTGNEPTYIHLNNNPHWYVLGEPGYLAVTSSNETGTSNRAESNQYRMSRSMASLAEYMVNRTLRQLTDATLGASIDATIDWWQDKPKYESIERLQGLHIVSSIQKVKDKDGKVWIRKEAPTTGLRSVLSYQYGAMANEVLTLEQIDHKNVIKIKDYWLEHPGTSKAKMVTILEAGESDLLNYNIQSPDELKDIHRQALQGLKAVHDAGFVHSDMKPENFVRMADGTIKLIDFGAAARIRPDGKAYRGMMDLFHLPPEGMVGSKASDIWSFGRASLSNMLRSNRPVSMREILEGKSLYTGSYFLPVESVDYRILAEAAPYNIFQLRGTHETTADVMQSGDLFKNIPGYSQFISRMLQLAPENRSSTEELLQDNFLRSEK